MNHTKENRYLLRAKPDAIKISSRPKPTTASSEKENLLLDYIRKQKIRTNAKNNTALLAGRPRKEDNVTESADLASKRKSKLQESLVFQKEDFRHKEHFNLTLGSKKDDKKSLFITADVSSAIKALSKQIKMDTMGSKQKKTGIMTQEDIDHLFEADHDAGYQHKLTARNLQLDRIKEMLEAEPQQVRKRSVKEIPKVRTANKDFADSVKYLELQEQEDKLLSALIQSNLVKVEPDKGVDKTVKFKEQFIVGKQIGEGAYASVRVAIYSSLNKKIAIKIYQKKKIKEPQRKKSVRREIKILQQANHPNVVKILDVVETNNHVNLIMEYIPGICLSSYLKSQPDFRLTQKQTKRMFQQLVAAVVYLHSLNVCHRDIKLENILLDNELSPKLIDFGFATCVDNNKKIKMFCGTPSFMAPEIVSKQEYKGPPADVWALGVVLFVLLTGVFPFKGQTDKQLYSKICSASYPNIEHLTPPARDLIQRMLSADPELRIAGHQILDHQWLQHPPLTKKSSQPAPSGKLALQMLQSRLLSKRKQDDSKERSGFGLTQPGFNLRQMLRQANGCKLTDDRSIQNVSRSRPSTPRDQILKKESKYFSKIDTPASSPAPVQPAVYQRLTNKIYF